LATKMLASTVQFSSYGRRPTPHPAPTHHRPHPTGRDRQASGSPKGGPARAGPPPGEAQSLKVKPKPDPSGPNSVPGADPPARPRSHPHPQRSASCTRSRPTSRRQLTDVPPSSTLPETRVRGRALDANPTGAGARCSLERR